MSEKTDKLISVIVPVYNIKEYITECIDSIIGQTYKKLEIILVDDGSSDGSGEICEEYAAKDNRIAVFHKENGGLSDARNFALSRAKGDLIACVDGDDWIHPQMYELMVQTMEMENADIVTCGFEQKNKDFANIHYMQKKLYIEMFSGAEALCNINIPLVVAWNKLYRSKLFTGIRYPKDKLHEDEFIIHKIFYRCRRVAVINVPLYFYTIRKGSIVAQMNSKRIDDALEALTDRVNFAYEQGWDEVKDAVVKRYCDYCIDRYNDLEMGKYENIETKYLNTLWQGVHDMLEKHSEVKIDECYRRFAASPEQYNVYMKRIAKKEKIKRLTMYIIHWITRILNI